MITAINYIDSTFDNWYVVGKFSKSGVYEKVPEGSTLVDTWISLKHSARLVERSLHAKIQIDPLIPSDRTLTCDRQIDRETDTDTEPQLVPVQ